jgi:hypothetical protein
MSAMPDTAVIVTGLVGAAGIAGTLLSARITARSDMAGLRLSITAEDERAQLAEKRRIYAGFHTSIDKLVVANSPIEAFWSTAGPDERQAMRSAQDAAITAMFNGLSEITLTGSEPISRQAEDLTRLLTSYADAILTETEAEALARAADMVWRQRSALYEAMRADLGTGQAPAG